MSSNTAIRITETENGRWEVLRYDVDQDFERYRAWAMSVAGGHHTYVSSLDDALNYIDAQDMTSEYGLEIVRLKDQKQTPERALEEAAEVYANSLWSSPMPLPVPPPQWWETAVQAFIAGANWAVSV